MVCKKENSAYLCSALTKRHYNKDDSVAQQVEHIPFKDGVLGSNPSWVTKGKRHFTDKSGKAF